MKQFLLILTIAAFIFSQSLTQAQVQNSSSVSTEQCSKADQSDKDSIRTELIIEVDKYIKIKGPGTRLTAESLVAACEHHEFDLVFAIAQAQIESTLGTKGKAAKTNSVWNVNQNDGRSVATMNKLGFSFTHPDQSIEPYIMLVKTKYLGEKRTYNDLMKNYVDVHGRRYASARDYERKLRNTYDYIVTKTRIQHLFTLLVSA